MEMNFIRVRSVKDIIVSTSLVISGSALLLLPTGTGVNLAGFFMIFAGLFTAIMLRTGYKHDETGVRYQKKEHYFQHDMKNVISSALESRPSSLDLTQVNKGNAVKLDIYYSKTSGKAYLQLFEYIPYRYEPCSRIYEHDMTKVDKLIK